MNEFVFNSIVQYEKNFHNFIKYIIAIVIIILFTVYFIYKIGPITFLIQILMFSLIYFVKKGPKHPSTNKKPNLISNKMNFGYYEIRILRYNNIENTFEMLIKKSEKIRRKLTDIKIVIPKNNIEKITLNSNDGAVIFFYNKAIFESQIKNNKVIHEKGKNYILFYIEKEKINDFKIYLKDNAFDYIEEDDKYHDD